MSDDENEHVKITDQWGDGLEIYPEEHHNVLKKPTHFILQVFAAEPDEEDGAEMVFYLGVDELTTWIDKLTEMRNEYLLENMEKLMEKESDADSTQDSSEESGGEARQEEPAETEGTDEVRPTEEVC